MAPDSTAGSSAPRFTRRRGRRLLFLAWSLCWIAAAVVGLEVASRWWLKPWHQEIGSRHMQPYFMSGGYYQTPLGGARAENVLLGPGGPETYGYRRDGSMYVFGFDEPVHSVADRGTFLFQDRVALANAAPDPNSVRVFVLGGSSAYGVGATQPDRRWYAVLERSLTESLGKRVDVIPAAMVGHVSTQERLALELMVLPRQPDAVVILDGWNDVALPALFGVRPGDPYDQGILYGDFYSAFGGFRRGIARHSALARYLVHRSMARAVAARQAELLASPERMAQYAASTASVYVDNLTRMLERCGHQRLPCAAFLQPSRDVITRGAEEDRRHALIVASYAEIRARLRQTPPGASARDLSELLPADLFVDDVHFNDEGHAAVARAMQPVVLELLRGS